ncbi:MAG: oligosaccharide flippase family protein [Stellaceae bacterium]
MKVDISGYEGPAARLARGSAVALILYLVAAGLAYLSQLMLARMIGAHGYGIYAYVLSWVTVLAYVSALGFDVSLLRFVTGYLTTHAFPLLRGIIIYASRRVAAMGLGISVLAGIGLLTEARGLPPDLFQTFLVGLVLVPILALLWISAAVVRAFGGVVSALTPDRILRDAFLVLALLICAAEGLRIDAPLAMTVTLLGAGAGLALVSFSVRRRLTRATIKTIAPVYDAQLWRRAALPLVVIGATDALMNRTGVLLLSWIAGNREAGIYALAFNIAFAITLPRTAINALLAPTMSDLFVRNDRAALQSIIGKTALWTLLGAVVIALPIFILARPLLGLCGQEFETGALALRILVIGQVIAAMAGSQLHLMNMTGRERSAAVLIVCSTLALAAVGAALISALGVTGAALAATVALVGWNAAMSVSIWRHLRLLPGMIAARSIERN